MKGRKFAITMVVAGFLLAVVSIGRYVSLSFLDALFVLSYRVGYGILWGSLLLSLSSVIATLVWYSQVRNEFSSPVKTRGASIYGVILCGLVGVALIQIYLAFLHPAFLYQISFQLFSIYPGMVVIRYIFTLGTALARIRREKDGEFSLGEEPPLVTVVVPAYNEEKVLGSTLQALVRLSYPRKEIVVVDDGSTDNTLKIARAYLGRGEVRVLSKPNGGKWDALNTGVEAAEGEIVVCIDADTVLEQDAVQHLVKHFRDPKMGAVAGNVKVGNRDSLLTKLQALEYTVGLGLFRRSEAYLRRVTIVPGCIGAFRTSLLKKVGMFEGDTFAEDGDLTLKILRAGYRTMYEPEAVGYTQTPRNLTDLAKQRYRWYRGYLQCLLKHKDMIFDSKYGYTGTFMLPWTLFKGVFCPWFTFFLLMWLLTFCFNPVSPYSIYHPLMEAFQGGITIYSPALHSAYIFWFFLLLALEVTVASYALFLDTREKPRLVLYILIHKLFYTYLMEILRMVSHLEELFHYPMKWERAERYKTIQEANKN